MKYKIVTCFDETLLNQNGANLLEKFKNSWHPDIEFHCYYYNLDINNYSVPSAKNIKYYNLNSIGEYEKFKENNSDHDGTEDHSIPYNEGLDALKAAAKVFAITECAFNNTDSWLIWIDPLSINTKDVRISSLETYFPPRGVEFSFLINQDHLMGFNLQRQSCVDMLGDWRGAYISSEYLNYRDWSSSFILNRLVTLYIAHGLKVNQLESINNLIVSLSERAAHTMRDTEGKRLIPLSETQHSPDILPNRYKQLADVIRTYKPKTILETGTWNGGRAIEMALAAFENTDAVHYMGFDLFEDATNETDEEEFNSKAHNTKAAVVKRLEEFKSKMKTEKNKDFTFELTKGNVRSTLNGLTLGRIDKADFALIGSGNSLETVEHEYKMIKSIPVVVMDHYFSKDEEERIPPEKYHGVKQVYDKVVTKNVKPTEEDDDGWTTFDEESTTRKFLLPSGDKTSYGGHTHLVVYLHDTDLPELPEDIKRVPIVVHPRDCVPKEYIRDNIKSNMTMIDRWVEKHPAHRGVGVLVSAGPCLDYRKLKKFLGQHKNATVLTVKHAYPGLLKNNIKPWGCIVLDPRSIEGKSTHNITRKDLFATLDPDTNFFIASMTDPSVTKFLKENKARMWGWHAYTDSLRDEKEQGKQIINQSVKLLEELGIPEGSTLITGGTCAAMRGIGMLHTMGFRNIHLFGFDCSREEPTKEEKTETTGDIEGGETPKPKYMEVNVKDKKYWTTGELLAMAQDCEKVFNDPTLDGVLSFHGEDTIVADLWKIKEESDKRIKFKGYYNA